MPARRTIGVDMGGTKLLAGAVDAGLGSITAPSARLPVSTRRPLLDIAVEAVQEARDAAGGEVAAVGFGIPCLIDQRTGIAVIAVNLRSPTSRSAT